MKRQCPYTGGMGRVAMEVDELSAFEERIDAYRRPRRGKRNADECGNCMGGIFGYFAGMKAQSNNSGARC
jgi:hypothetical protein